MISHIYIGALDFEVAFKFYAAIMAELDWSVKFVEKSHPWAAGRPKGQDRPLLLLGRAYDGQPAAPGNGQMVAFTAVSRRKVDAFYNQALASGGSCEGPPGLRQEYHPNYYGSYVRDPSGNKICACCHDAE